MSDNGLLNEIIITNQTYDLKVSQMDANGLGMKVNNWERMYVKHTSYLIKELEKMHEEISKLRMNSR